MAAFWPCKGPQLSEAAEGRGGLETQDLPGARSCACRRSQTVYLHAASWVRRQGVVELVGTWGDCSFVGDSNCLAPTFTAWECGPLGE